MPKFERDYLNLHCSFNFHHQRMSHTHLPFKSMLFLLSEPPSYSYFSCTWWTYLYRLAFRGDVKSSWTFCTLFLNLFCTHYSKTQRHPHFLILWHRKTCYCCTSAPVQWTSCLFASCEHDRHLARCCWCRVPVLAWPSAGSFWLL